MSTALLLARIIHFVAATLFQVKPCELISRLNFRTDAERSGFVVDRCLGVCKILKRFFFNRSKARGSGLHYTEKFPTLPYVLI